VVAVVVMCEVKIGRLVVCGGMNDDPLPRVCACQPGISRVLGMKAVGGVGRCGLHRSYGAKRLTRPGKRPKSRARACVGK